MTELRIKSPYRPRESLRHIHRDDTQFITIVAHRGCGKTHFAINDLIDGMLIEGKPTDMGLYLAPWKNQAKGNTWAWFKQYLSHIPKDISFADGYKLFFNESETKVILPTGGTIYLAGADDPDALRGRHWKHVVVDEVADMPQNIWTEILRPAVTISKGKVRFIGTPKGDDEFKKMYDRGLGHDPIFYNWKSYMITDEDSGLISDQERLQLLAELGEEVYNQEYRCHFNTASEGTFYGRSFKNLVEQNRVGTGNRFDYNPNFPVTVSFDLGVADLTTMWFTQLVDGELVHIDYYQNNEQNAEFYAQILAARGYRYDEHIIPHDGSKRTWGIGDSSIQSFEAALLKHKVTGYTKICPKIDVIIGINATRSALSISRFNAAKCELGIKALMNYRKKYNSKNGMYEESPTKSTNNHAADAFRYMALAFKKTNLHDMKSNIHRIDNPLVLGMLDKYNPFKQSKEIKTIIKDPNKKDGWFSG